jgi:hypothetical protein
MVAKRLVPQLVTINSIGDILNDALKTAQVEDVEGALNKLKNALSLLVGLRVDSFQEMAERLPQVLGSSDNVLDISATLFSLNSLYQEKALTSQYLICVINFISLRIGSLLLK